MSEDTRIRLILAAVEAALRARPHESLGQILARVYRGDASVSDVVAVDTLRGLSATKKPAICDESDREILPGDPFFRYSRWSD